MCIRDSAYAMYIVRATPRHIRRQVPMVLSLVGLSGKAKKESMSVQLQTAKNEKSKYVAQLSKEEQDIQAVSYTHLDVYKRQHQMIEDISLMRTLPNMTVISTSEMCIRDRTKAMLVLLLT